MEPSVGLASEYATNPLLNLDRSIAQSNEAILIDDPIHYDLDKLHVGIDPSLRFGDRGGYASLASNYYHLNGIASFLSDVNTISVKAALARDSSLYQNGLSSNGLGVRVDSASASVEWQRQITERAAFSIDGGWTRGLYNQAASDSGLSDYRYLSAAAAATYAASERNTLQLSVNAGQYRTLDNLTSSSNWGAQVGLDRRLSELWTLSTTAGYSQSENSQKLYSQLYFIGSMQYGPYYLGTAHAKQQGPIVDLALTRAGETFTAKAHLSRAYVPSGFSFLSRQDLADLQMKYVPNDRWSYTAGVSYQDSTTPGIERSAHTTHFWSSEWSAAWLWTPNWRVSLTTRWVRVRYDEPPATAQSTSVSLKVTRQFLRIDL